MKIRAKDECEYDKVEQRRIIAGSKLVQDGEADCVYYLSRENDPVTWEPGWRHCADVFVPCDKDDSVVVKLLEEKCVQFGRVVRVGKSGERSVDVQSSKYVEVKPSPECCAVCGDDLADGYEHVEMYNISHTPMCVCGVCLYVSECSCAHVMCHRCAPIVTAAGDAVRRFLAHTTVLVSGNTRATCTCGRWATQKCECDNIQRCRACMVEHYGSHV